MYGVKFSLWLTGAIGPQAVAGRHSSTRPLAGGVYIESGRPKCRPPVFAWRDGVASPAGKPGKLPGRVGRHPRQPDSMETAGGRCMPSRHHPAPTVQVLENSKTWLSIIICSLRLMLWIDLWWFFLNLGGC